MSDEKKLDGELKEAQLRRASASLAWTPKQPEIRAGSGCAPRRRVTTRCCGWGRPPFRGSLRSSPFRRWLGMLINGSYAIIDSVFLGHAVGRDRPFGHDRGQPHHDRVHGHRHAHRQRRQRAGGPAPRRGQARRMPSAALGNVVSLSLVCCRHCGSSSGANPGAGLLGCSIWRAPRRRCAPTPRRSSRSFAAGFILQCIGLGVNNFIRTCRRP